MTVSYQLDVSSASALSFFRLLFRWKASIWKIVLKELFIWTALYLIIAFIYRTNYFMNENQKIIFEEVAYYCHEHMHFIPLTFILGFFVNIIVSRWSDVFINMGYIESQAIIIGNYVRGDDVETRLMRRAMVRYMCLSQALVYRDISVRVRKRFPTYESLIEAGFLMPEEKEKLDSIQLNYAKYWAPINWIFAMVFDARKAEKICHDIMVNKICDEVKNFRQGLQLLCNYDWVPLPLIYPQAVFLVVYVYFAACLIARQHIITDRDGPFNSQVDYWFPIMTMIQFFFFIGWVKVAEGLLNPFGDDDDDFECNFLLDKNLATSLCIVDDQYDSAPEVMKDRFWKKALVEPLYPESTMSDEVRPLVGSAVNAKVDAKGDQPSGVRGMSLSTLRRSSRSTASDGCPSSNHRRKRSSLRRMWFRRRGASPAITVDIASVEQQMKENVVTSEGADSEASSKERPRHTSLIHNMKLCTVPEEEEPPMSGENISTLSTSLKPSSSLFFNFKPDEMEYSSSVRK